MWTKKHNSSLLLQLVLIIIAANTINAFAAPGWPFDMSWSYANANAVHDQIALMYYPHSIALLDADSVYQNGKPAREIIRELRKLPGVKVIIVSSGNFKLCAQYPDTFLELKSFSTDLLKLPQANRRSIAPMYHTVVGGKVQFVHVLFGDGSLSLLTRFVHPDSLQPATAAISLVLDKEWLIEELPSKLDSLARESTQLLFWAQSPQNHDVIQALGVLNGADTLWWMGPKNVNVGITQGLWPFPDIQVHTFVHWIGPSYEMKTDSINAMKKRRTMPKEK